jgi:hypothetical protein
VEEQVADEEDEDPIPEEIPEETAEETPDRAPASPEADGELPRRRRQPNLAAPSSDPQAAQLLERASGEPGVKKLLREFGAQVVDIRPLEPPRDLNPDDEKTEPVEDTR